MSELEETSVHNVALDPGFGGFKSAMIVDGTIRTATVPSVVGVGETDLGLLSLAGVTGRRRRRKQFEPYRVTFPAEAGLRKGADMLVGAGVAEYARPVERLDFQRLGESPELRVLTYATLFELLSGRESGAGTLDLNLVVGLPVEVLQGQEANETVRRLKGWLVGEHRFAVDGQETTLHIRRVVPMAQPVGAFCEWGLGLDGRWARDRDDALATVAVLDLGFNTLDLLGVRNGRISARYTEGDTLGMRRAAQALVQSVRSQYQVGDLSLHEADGLVRGYNQSQGRRPVKLSVPGGRRDVSHLVSTAIDVAAGEVSTFVEQVWGEGGRFAYLLLTGGGCLALGQRLQRQLRHAVVLDDPVTANARGLARAAQRMFK